MKTFRYGVLSVDKENSEAFIQVNPIVKDLDRALELYKKYKLLWPDKIFKLVRIDFHEMEVIDE